MNPKQVQGYIRGYFRGTSGGGAAQGVAMQFFFVLLVLAIFVYDAQPHSGSELSLSGVNLLAGVYAPPLLCAALYWVACRFTLAHLSGLHAARLLRWLGHAGWAYRLSVLVMYSLNLWGWGLLDVVRRWVGDGVLIDEVIFMAPSVALLVWSWWAHYPIDRRVREASLMGRLDRGEPVGPIWTRGQYVTAMLRHQGAAFLLPALLILGWSESVELYWPTGWVWGDADPRPAVTLAGCLALMVMAPAIIRRLWDTDPIPPGELRHRLTSLCDLYGVRVRRLLVWRTFGAVVNAAVMGVIGPVRYILLSDALLERMSIEHIEAVMAHEIAHIRRHHMFWLMVIGAVSLAGLLLAWAVGLDALMVVAGVMERNRVTGVYFDSTAADASPHSQEVMMTLAMAGALACWSGLFGWVSRRFERQADTFAVQHLTLAITPDPSPQSPPEASPEVLPESSPKALQQMPQRFSSSQLARAPSGPARIDPRAIGLMVGALSRVADLNHIPRHRRSWRHGSIAWRQAYLRTLLDQPIDDLPIDRQVLRIKTAAVVAGVVLLALQSWAPAWVAGLLTG